MGLTYDEKSCGIVLYRQTDEQRLYLVLKYPGGHFDFVKGHVEEGETEHETATRELIEETGISDVTYVDGYRENIEYDYYKYGKPSHKLVVFFLGKTTAKDVTISHEHHDFYWLPYDQALEKVTFDNAKQLLVKAEKLLTSN